MLPDTKIFVSWVPLLTYKFTYTLYPGQQFVDHTKYFIFSETNPRYVTQEPIAQPQS